MFSFFKKTVLPRHRKINYNKVKTIEDVKNVLKLTHVYVREDIAEKENFTKYLEKE